MGRPLRGRGSQKTCLGGMAYPRGLGLSVDLEDKKGKSPDRFGVGPGIFFSGSEGATQDSVKEVTEMKRGVVLLVLSLAFPLPFSVQAGEEGDKERAEFTMEEVVVTATKTEEKRKDVPNAVIIIDKLDIEESPAKTMGELLANDPGVDWRTYGDYGGASEEIHIRGMSGNATQIRLNGVAINSPSLGVADVSGIPLNAIERIEVVKGSGSLLYGSGAMAGTINIITKGPRKDEVALKAKAGAGTQGSYLAEAEQGMFLDDDFGYYLTARGIKTDGFRSNSDLTDGDMTMKLVFDRGKALNVNLYGDFISRDYGRPGVKPPPGTQSYFINGVEFLNSESASLLDRGRDNDGHLILQATSKPTTWLDINLRGDYTYMENYNYYRSPFDATGARTWVTNRVSGAEGDLTFKPFSAASLLLGTEYKAFSWENENRDLDSGGGDVPDSYSKFNANLHSVGTYLEGQYRPSIYFKGLAGIRHEKNSQFGSEDLPRFGVIVNPFKNTALKANTGRHFLAPTPNDLYWPEGPYTKGNPNLKPETGWHTDLTLEQTLFKDRLFFTLTYFNWNVKNKILWGPDANWIYTPQNLNKYRGDGVEAGTKIGPFYSLTLGLFYTYTNADEENQYVTRKAPYTARHLFKGELTYWTDFGLTASLVERYVGDRYYYGGDDTATSPQYVLPSYWTTDIRLDQRIHNHWVFSLRADNLFNKEYDTYLGAFTDPQTYQTTVSGFPGAGRSFLFTASYEY
jgi:outer membrane cobalamin receptor